MNLSTLTVVAAEPKDASAILNLQKRAYLSEAQLHDDFSIPPLTQTLEELIAEFALKRIVKIELDGVIIASGQAKQQGDTCHIGRMAVEPNLIGKGIGSKLLAELEQSFSDVTYIELFTGEKSVANLTMYQRRGYRPFDERMLGKTRVIFLRKSREKTDQQC